MIGRRSRSNQEDVTEEPRGFDDFDLRLGDVMRGERATMGKSLLDVERDLRIKASYIAAIENADPSAFDTPGFIPGYVRSYARYLGMDPDRAYHGFCAESGFSTAHGMSAEASSIRKSALPAKPATRASDDPLISPSTPFTPASESFLSRIEPGAIGSAVVLIALIGGIGYGGWSVLKEVQRVTMAPVESAPDVLSDLDPLDGMVAVARDDGADSDPERMAQTGDDDVFRGTQDERLDRLYRPDALDVPVMVARDAPISTLDPSRVGTISPETPSADRSSAERMMASARLPVSETDAESDTGSDTAPTPKVIEEPKPNLQIVAVRPAWVRVRAADGSVIYEGIMNAGESYDVPATEEPPTLRAGESGAVYFAVNGDHYGPAGASGAITADLTLDPQTLTAAYSVADMTQDQDLSRYVAELQDEDTEMSSQ